MGLRPIQGDEKRLVSSHHFLFPTTLPFVIPERSRGICSSADLSWKCFSAERGAVDRSAASSAQTGAG
jgi:hypothetical protein